LRDRIELHQAEHLEPPLTWVKTPRAG